MSQPLPMLLIPLSQASDNADSAARDAPKYAMPYEHTTESLTTASLPIQLACELLPTFAHETYTRATMHSYTRLANARASLIRSKVYKVVLQKKI